MLTNNVLSCRCSFGGENLISSFTPVFNSVYKYFTVMDHLAWTKTFFVVISKLLEHENFCPAYALF